MAENKERKTFKWGDQEYLIDDLLNLHITQGPHFYNFAREKGSYDDPALAGLRNAIDHRINAVREGKSFSADGILDGDVADNVTIQTQKNWLPKKNNYVEQDNTEWAKYYLNKLVAHLKPYQREDTTSSKDWDISKYGFEAYLKGQGLDARDVFENYDLRDANNPDAVRSYTQRDEQLRKHLAAYKTWLEGKGFDFTKNDNEWDDNFMATLSDLINSNDWSDRTALAASLRKLGAGDGYATAFTSGKWDLSKSQADLEEEAKAKKEAEEAKQQSIYLDEFEDLAYSKKRESNPIKYKGYDGDFTWDWYADLNAEQQSKYGTYLGDDNDAWTRAWNQLMQSFKDGTSYSDKNAGILLQGALFSNPQGFVNLGDGNYLIRDSVTEYGQGTIYNPSNGYTNTVFLGDLAGNNNEIQNIYRQLAYNYVKTKHGVDYNKRPDVLKAGGELIPKHQYGNTVVFNWDSSNEKAVKVKAKENNLDPAVQKARDRYTNSDNKSLANPDAGLTTEDIIRLGSIGADVVSMFLDPVSGTVLGLGSTLANFGVDVSEDGLQWEDVKNLGINVGFDLLGAIPIFGDAVGTGTKIIRKLGKYIPRVMTALAAYQGYENFDGMMDSWQKMLSSGENAKMTVQDWRNVAQSLNLILGGARATKNKITQNKIKKQAKVDGAIGVNIRRKDSSDVEQILVDGDIADKIRKADRNPEKIKKALSELDDFKSGEFEVVTRLGNPQLPWGKVIENGKTTRGWRSPFSAGEAQVTDVYDFSKIGKNKWFATVADNLSSKGTPKTKIDHTETKQKILDGTEVPKIIDNLKKELSSRNESIQNINQRINDTNEEIASLRRSIGDTSFESVQKSELLKLEKELPSIKAIRLASNNVSSYTAKRNKAQARKETIGNNRDTQLKNLHEGINSKVNQIDEDLKKLKNLQKYYKGRVKANPEFESKLNTINSDIELALQKREKLIQTYEQARNRILTKYDKLDKDLTGSIGKYNTVINRSREIAAQRQLRKESQNRYDAATRGIDAEERLNALKNSKDQLSLTNTPLRSLEDLSDWVRSLRWDYPNRGYTVEGVLKSYGLNPDLFKQSQLKQGGVINRNKINKFLTYAKG